jgi:hypothetical protein
MNAVVAEQIRTTVEARLRELAPVLSELEQLQSVLAVLDDPETCRRLATAPVLPTLGGDPGGSVLSATAPVTPLRRPRRLGSAPGRDGRAPQGANKQRILTVIAAHPGIAAPQIAKLTGLKRPVVASTISRLKRTGELCAHGSGVCLPDDSAIGAPVSPNVHHLPSTRMNGDSLPARSATGRG